MQPLDKTLKNTHNWRVTFENNFYVVKNDNGNRLPQVFTSNAIAESYLQKYLAKNTNIVLTPRSKAQ